MQLRPQTGGAVQNYLRAYSDDENWQQRQNQQLKANVFIPTMKYKKNLRGLSSKITQIAHRQRIEEKPKDLYNTNISFIKNKNIFDIDETIKDLNDFLQCNTQKNNFFEKNILESTKPDDTLTYQEPEIIEPQKQNYNLQYVKEKQEYRVQENYTQKYQDIKSFQNRKILLASARLHQNSRGMNIIQNKSPTKTFFTNQTKVREFQVASKMTQSQLKKRADSFGLIGRVQNFMNKKI